MTRIAAALVLGAALLTASPPAAAQAPVELAPFAFEVPPGFARAGDGPNAVVLRDVDGGQLSVEVFPGASPLRGRTATEITEALAGTISGALSPEGFAWIEPPATEIRADGLAVFTALAARRNPRGDAAVQAVLYAIGPDATLYVGYAGVGQPAAARGAIAAIARSLRASR